MAFAARLEKSGACGTLLPRRYHFLLHVFAGACPGSGASRHGQRTSNPGCSSEQVVSNLALQYAVILVIGVERDSGGCAGPQPLAGEPSIGRLQFRDSGLEPTPVPP